MILMIWHRLGKDMTDTLGPFTLQLVLGLRSAKLKLGTGWCIYICYLDQTWKKKEKKKAESKVSCHHHSKRVICLLYMSRTKLSVSDS